VATLIYSMNVSADGYVEDADGSLDFTEPSEELHRWWNRRTEQASALLYGRGLYEVMEDFWTAPERADGAEVEAEFARAYVATPRIVFSDSLESVAPGCRLVRSADAAAEVRRLKEEYDGSLDVGGPGLAATLLEHIDEFQPVVVPAVAGGGKPFFPPGARIALRLVEQHVFGSGAVALRYQRV
jgi:dihydrofolate reductase